MLLVSATTPPSAKHSPVQGWGDAGGEGGGLDMLCFIELLQEGPEGKALPHPPGALPAAGGTLGTDRVIHFARKRDTAKCFLI